MRSALSIGAVLLTLNATAVAGTVVYVDANATGPVHDGSSWCSAYLDLQQALAVAVAGSEIRVAQGVYQPAPAGGSRDAAFAVPSGVSLLGSHRGCGTPDPDARNFILYATVLSGDLDGDDGPNFANRTDNVYHVVTTHDVAVGTVLDGLTFQSGQADGANAGPSVLSRDQGGGVNNYHGQPTLSNCTLLDNFMANHGAFNDHGKATLIDCEFRNNLSGNVAGGLYMHFATDTTVIGCDFIGNSTAGRGGGAYLKGDSAPSFTGCLFSGNGALRGGGMYCDSNNTPTLDNCTFDNNVAGPDSGRGGGVYAQDSNLDLVGCTFKDNACSGDNDSGGVAIYIQNGTLNLDQSDFLDNQIFGSLVGPGAVYNNGSTSTITRCLFDGNHAARYGGALRNTENSNVTVQDCVFNGNSSYWGTIFNTSSVAEISRCRFTNGSGNYGAIQSSGSGGITVSDSVFLSNVAGQWNGAAMSLAGGGSYTVRSSFFAGNSAAIEGGAIASNARELSLINCVFSGNNADSLGGAIALRPNGVDAQTTVSNCSFFGNTAGTGNAIAISEFPGQVQELTAVNSVFFNGGSEFWEEDPGVVNMAIAHSDIEGGWPGVGNIADNPLFIDPDGADDLTGTEDDDLRLMGTSPCANAGDNAAVVSATDADDLPRIMFGVVDMGAFELQEPSIPTGEPAVPAASEWGLAIMAMLLATAGTLVLRRVVT